MQRGTPFGFPTRRPPTKEVKPEKLSKFGETYKSVMALRRKYQWLVNYSIFYGWIPFAIYKGLNSGTHKYVEESSAGRPQSRPPRVSDLVPILGSHGLP